MKVLVLECGWNYDGNEVIGVYKERKDAETESEKQMNSDRNFDWSNIEEFEVK